MRRPRTYDVRMDGKGRYAVKIFMEAYKYEQVYCLPAYWLCDQCEVSRPTWYFTPKRPHRRLMERMPNQLNFNSLAAFLVA